MIFTWPLLWKKEIERNHAQWWGPGIKAHWDAANASPLEEVDSTISARTADPCNETLGQELTADEERKHGAPVRDAKARVLGGCPWNICLAEVQRFRTCAEGGTVQSDCGDAFGAHVEDGRWREGCESSLGGQRVPSSGPEYRPGGDIALRWHSFISSSGYFPERARVMETVESGH